MSSERKFLRRLTKALDAEGIVHRFETVRRGHPRLWVRNPDDEWQIVTMTGSKVHDVPTVFRNKLAKARRIHRGVEPTRRAG